MMEWSRHISEWWNSTVHSSRTVAVEPKKSGHGRYDQWLLAIILGLGFGLIGPYGAYLSSPIWFRIIYWEIVIIAGFTIWWVLETFMGRFLKPESFALRNLTIIVPFAAANSTFVVTIHSVISSFTGFPIGVTWPTLFVSHIVLSTLVIFPTILIVRRIKIRVETEAGGAAIRFLTDKLPPTLRGSTPFALSAEGHYVRVYTHLGDEMVTMRFEDAVQAVIGIDGLQVHRSWWIALDQIIEITSAGSAYEAKLKTELVVPVSRRRKSALTQAMKRHSRSTS